MSAANYWQQVAAEVIDRFPATAGRGTPEAPGLAIPVDFRTVLVLRPTDVDASVRVAVETPNGVERASVDMSNVPPFAVVAMLETLAEVRTQRTADYS